MMGKNYVEIDDCKAVILGRYIGIIKNGDTVCTAILATEQPEEVPPKVIFSVKPEPVDEEGCILKPIGKDRNGTEFYSKDILLVHIGFDTTTGWSQDMRILSTQWTPAEVDSMTEDGYVSVLRGDNGGCGDFRLSETVLLLPGPNNPNYPDKKPV
jgi:hypothetical protein